MVQKLRGFVALVLAAGCTGSFTSPEEKGEEGARPDRAGAGGARAQGGAPAAGSGGGGGAGGTSAVDAACVPGQGHRGSKRLARLTPLQYRNTVAGAFEGRLGPTRTSVAFPKNVENPLQVWPSAHFSTDTGGHTLNEFEVRQSLIQTASLGTALVAKVKTTSGSCLANGSTVPFTDCARTLIASKGELLFRRPLTDDELASYLSAVTNNAAAIGGEAALAVAFQALLMAPATLFASELGDANGRLTGYEVAAAIAYRLTDYPPDEALWSSAKAGRLTQPDEIAAQVARLLAGTAGTIEGRPSANRFVEELFEYAGVLDAFKTAPGYDRDALYREAKATTAEILRESGRRGFFAALLTSPVGHVSDKTAVLYGQPAVTQMTKVTFAADERAGLLTHPAFLANFADMDVTEPVKRGLFLSERVLCRPVPELPIGMVPPLPPATAETSMRTLLAEHTKNPSCRACHQFMDPLGLALEVYDHTGKRRAAPVDTSGELTDSGDQDGPFRDGFELIGKLARSQAVEQCFVGHSFEYWLGRKPDESDACTLADARDAYTRNGGDYLALVQSLFTSRAFLEREDRATP